jgi:hypothetical protein
MFDLMWGRRPTRKQRRRIQLEENIRKGKAAEKAYLLNATLRGIELQRTGRGHNFIEKRRDLFTGKVKSTTRVEVKSSARVPLSRI